jgi:hypothetical protein
MVMMGQKGYQEEEVEEQRGTMLRTTMAIQAREKGKAALRERGKERTGG